MTRFVFLSTHRGVAGQLATADPQGSQHLTLVVGDGLGDSAEGAVRIIDVGAVGGPREGSLWQRSAALRTLVRLSPADGGARMARRVRASADAQAALRAADVVVACDRDSVYAAWRATTGARSAALGLSGISGGLAAVRRAVAG